jgi:hypothetical protein
MTLAAILAATAESDVVSEFVRLIGDVDMTEAEEERLRSYVVARTKIGPRLLDRSVKAAKAKRQSERNEAERNRMAAERRRFDRRAFIPAPATDAPFLPVMEILNDVLKKSSLPSRQPEISTVTSRQFESDGFPTCMP